MDEELEQIFLDELAALDRMRITYSGTYPNTPLSRDDPDVRRLLEGLAMFTARTRVAGERALHKNVLRIFRQHFAHLLGPAPAMGMVRAKPTSRFVDPAVLPADSEILFVEPGERGGNDRIFRFRTLGDLRILPLELVSLTPRPLADKGWRFIFQFRWTTGYAMKMDVGDLHLHINHLDDLASSLTISHALETYKRGSCIVFDQMASEDTEGTPCTITFGAPKRRDSLRRGEHPFRDIRNVLRFPGQQLYMNIHGITLPKAVETFSVCLDVKPGFPVELRPMQDGFELFAIPIINERLDMADPIEHDGTKERYPVLHPDVTAKFVPIDIFGVYRITDKGLDPIEPAVISTRPKSSGDSNPVRPTYDVTYEGINQRRMAFVSAAIQNAFLKPVDLAVEATWHQPAVDTLSLDNIRVAPATRHFSGLEWSHSGPLCPHIESEIQEDDQELLELLSIKHQRALQKEHVQCLLRAVGAGRGSTYEKFMNAMLDLEVERKPAAKSATGFKYVYKFKFGELGPTEIPKFEVYCHRLYDLIAAWCSEHVVELIGYVVDGRATVHVKEKS